MSVTPIGIALLLLALYFLIAQPKRLMQALVFFASFSGTSVLNFSSFGVSPAMMFLGFYLFWGVVTGRLTRPVTLGRNHPGLVLCIIAFATYTLGALLLNGGQSGIAPLQVTQTVYLFVGVLVVAVLSFDMSRDGALEAAVSALRAGACFIAGWGVLQAACFYAGLEYPAFLFNNSTSHFADMFDQRAADGIIRIASVATEPSFMASSLMIFGTFGATLVVCEPRFRTRGWMLPVMLVLAVVVASTSTTGFFALATLALLLALRRPGIVLLASIGALIVATVALLLLPGFRNAIYIMTLGKATTSSFTDRTASLNHAIAQFTAQPWLGGGWGSDFSYSIISNMAANVGLIGSALFTVALAGTVLTSRGARHHRLGAAQWRLRSYAVGAENAMIVYMAQAAVSGFKYVVPDFWVLWAIGLAIPSVLMQAATRRHRTNFPLAQRTGFAPHRFPAQRG